MAEEEIDPEILAVFLDESVEALADLAARFVALETDVNDRQAVDAIFRTVHTIKGNAAFFGLMRVKRLAHEMEDMLSLMRDARLPVTHDAISLLLRGIDLVTQMVTSVRNGEGELSAVNRDDVEQLIEKVSEHAHADASGGLGAVLLAIEQILGGPADVQAIRERLKALKSHVVELHQQATGTKPGSEVQADKGPYELARELLHILGKEPSEDPTKEQADRINELIHLLDQALTGEDSKTIRAMRKEHDRVVEAAGFVGLLREELLAQANRLEITKRPDRKVAVPNSEAKRAEPAARTMRVEEGKIDQFLDYVGELILVREMFVNVGKQVRDSGQSARVAAEYQRALEAFTLLSHSLQDSIMAVRKVSIRVALQKVPRMARDLAEKREKEVRVEVYGETVAVDKSLLESIEGPLTHMVRNAVDHGIEPPATREEKGKPREGTLSVIAAEEADYVRIEVRDDGGGINADKLKNKALKTGLINEHQAGRMSEQEAFDLLFAPGLSTAEQVTDISGRGVGMDVVRRNVVEMGGEIKITSQLGKGTAFTLLLPKSVTVQILDGFLVRVADQRFVLPLQVIKESFRPNEEDVVTVASRGEYISRRGQVFPLMRFGEVLKVSQGGRSDAKNSIVVSVDMAGADCAGLLVDEVLGVQQVVLREVHGIDVGGAPFTGGAVLGDGRVAMVVDVDRLANLV